MTENEDIHALNLKLGRQTSGHALDPIPRALGRQSITPDLPEFYGFDVWNAYETSFLLPDGKPVVYHMQVRYDAHTPYMVESKSLKLFLNAQADKVFKSLAAFKDHVAAEIADKVGGPVELRCFAPDQSPAPHTPPGICIDHLRLSATTSKGPAKPQALAQHGEFAVYTHLLRTNCPVTNQPDWGCVSVRGGGTRKLDPESFLAYIISFRDIQEFHETCCEKIFTDLHHLLDPDSLEVTCYYTRRGGIDINPRRTTQKHPPELTYPVWRQ